MFLGALVAGVGAIAIFYYFGAGLPDYKQLARYEPPIVTRLYSSDGRLFAEYAYEKRIYVPIHAIPQRVKDAFLAAEDKNFYHHLGIDVGSIIRAGMTNLSNMGKSKRPIGASTITQQVAKNFLLSDISHAVSIERKIKEAILSFRIEKAFSKDYILELYLNEVYLGAGAHGVAAAALNYFNKSLEELSIAEAAFLAALPKAPSRYHPKRAKEISLVRRNWVLERMYEDGFITAREMRQSQNEDILMHERDSSQVVNAPYFAEEVRRNLVRILGEKSLYQNGYVVRTTLDPTLQKMAEQSLREGLNGYDRKHGWRGPLMKLQLGKVNPALPETWLPQLKEVVKPAGAGTWELAVVLAVQKNAATIGLTTGGTAQIPLEGVSWAQRWISDTTIGPAITAVSQVLAVGDVVLVSKLGAKGTQYQLEQIPAVSGAIVALEPHTGRVLAMQGGYSFEMSQFNRATQAMRQTGSAFKTFVFLGAFESGMTPSSRVYDLPFSISMGWGLGIWAPRNWDEKFMGPMTLRQAFELSRNAATVRVVHDRIGMKRIVNIAKRFNIDTNMPMQLSGVLGACETTVLRMAAAYAMIANGGRLVVPSFFDHVQDRRGRTVLMNTHTVCEDCTKPDPDLIPTLKDQRPQVTDPISAFQTVSLLQGVVERGTGKLLRELNIPVFVKSGTTNDFKDAWMAGGIPSLIVVVYVGFDTPRTLGVKHYGAVVAGPIFKDFLAKVVGYVPAKSFKVPEGVKLVRVEESGGEAGEEGGEAGGTRLEVYREGDTVPDETARPADSDGPAAGEEAEEESEGPEYDPDRSHQYEQWKPVEPATKPPVSGTGALY